MSAIHCFSEVSKEDHDLLLVLQDLFGISGIRKVPPASFSTTKKESDKSYRPAASYEVGED